MNNISIYIKKFNNSHNNSQLISDIDIIAEEKNIKIYPITIIKNDENYLSNLIWNIMNLHFLDFYKIDDYEIMSISKVISAIIEHDKNYAVIDNDMIKECFEFFNDILYSNKENIIRKLFFISNNDFNDLENLYKNICIEELLVKSNSNYEIKINSYFEEENIINAVFIYNNKSFSDKIFFSRKIDVFISVMQSILKILLISNLKNTAYIYNIAEYNNINDYNITEKIKSLNEYKASERDFILKLNEINMKDSESLSHVKNIYDLIELFFKHYNFNFIIENFILNKDYDKLIELFDNHISKGKNIIITSNDEYTINILSDKFKNTMIY